MHVYARERVLASRGHDCARGLDSRPTCCAHNHVRQHVPYPDAMPQAPDPHEIPPQIRAAIEAELDTIECEHNVRVLWAIESGSRAWGFPSPDSDFDARFIYIYERDWYLGIAPSRDVIESPVDKVFDVSGWGLRKAL